MYKIYISGNIVVGVYNKKKLSLLSYAAFVIMFSDLFNP